ncbi:alpha/beta hydrolase [Streptomyces sulfonofaciens]|uniref:Alpha/beta hydrolase n=1 Tax=Streptomyces sulfonofaciens TaxID=68272 RepID=A0A919FU46_9ACTN|nr:alpha/beta hydrolase [Streptomyces sulfonofaciens]GHH72497.1 alpha/beta hydrolase [Streptomyces sulfonofaciens]
MISRRTVSGVLAVGLAATAGAVVPGGTASAAGAGGPGGTTRQRTTAAGATRRPGRRVRNVVLVHGAYADGSSWSDVTERLQSAGMNVTAVQNPLTSLADDVAATERALALQDGPTVLAAHSWGGTVISQAGLAPNVTGLVYVAARAPMAGEDYTALAGRFPTPPANAQLVESGGFKQLSREGFLDDFANGVPRRRALALYAAQGRIADSLFPGSTTTAAAWQHLPTWYAVSKNDRTTAPELERFLAARMGATTIELAAGHLSIVTHPDDIARLILQAADHPA